MSNLLNKINCFFMKIKEDIQKYTTPKNKLHIHPESILSSRNIVTEIPINMNTTESSVVLVEKEEKCCLVCRNVEMNDDCSKCDYYPGVVKEVEKKAEEPIVTINDLFTVKVAPSVKVPLSVEVPPSVEENNILVTPVNSAVASINDNNSTPGTPTSDDID